MATQPSDTSKHRTMNSPADELAVIAQRAQAFTNASGAAIAIGEGNADEIVCRARSGSSAPDIGAVLRVQGTFTGLCIQTGRELRCDDAETDTRVDTAAIRALGIRSMVITPIKEDNKAVGVLAVFASTPHAFTITHVAVLKTMADQIATLLLRERRAKEETTLHPELPPGLPKPPVAAVPPAPVMVKPSVPVHPPSAPVIVSPRSAGSPAARIDPIRPVALAADVSAPAVPFPKREERRVEVGQEPAPKTGTYDAVAVESGAGGGDRSKMIMAVVVLLAIGAAAGTWQYVRVKRSRAAAAQATPQIAALAPTATPPADANAGASAGVNPAATGNGAPVAAAPSTSPAAQPPSSRITVTERSDARKAADAQRQQQKPSPAEPATVALSSAPSKIAVGGAQPPTASPDAPPPSLSVGASPGMPGALKNLAQPGAAPVPAAVVQSKLIPVQLQKSVPPIYPEIAKVRRLSDIVTLDVVVGKDGKVASVKFRSGMPVFREAAIDAVKQWVYKPALLNGQPIEQSTEVKLNFKP